MDCELLTVGTELLLGFTVDTNGAELGRALAAAGIRVPRRATVPDELAAVKEAVAAALDRTGAVIVTGGLGPTRDDLTRQAVAVALGRKLVLDPAVLAGLEELFRKRGAQPMPEANRSQAEVPEGATVIPNRWGTAPALWVEDERGRLAVLLPGVPNEMRNLLEHEVLPRLVERMQRAGAPARQRAVIASRVIRTTGISESALADKLGDYRRHLGPHLTLAWIPTLYGVDLRLTAWDLPAAEAEAALGRAAQALRPSLGQHAYGEGDDDLAALVLRQLESAGARLAVAESCTGGLLGARLTAIPGSSRVFVGGVVAYDDEVKLGLLGVSADALAAHGAVSEEVARQMAAGVARALGAEAAVSVTGIAGPDGGSEVKPVGTVWVGAEWHGVVRAFSHQIPGGRDAVRQRAAQAALNYLRRIVAGSL